MSVTDHITYTDTRSPQDRNRICFQGRLMSMRQAKDKGYVRLLHTPHIKKDGRGSGGEYVGYTLPEEGKLNVSELDLDMKITIYDESMTIREAAEEGHIRILKENVTKYLPVGYEYLDNGIKTVTRKGS